MTWKKLWTRYNTSLVNVVDHDIYLEVVYGQMDQDWKSEELIG